METKNELIVSLTEELKLLREDIEVTHKENVEEKVLLKNISSSLLSLSENIDYIARTIAQERALNKTRQKSAETDDFRFGIDLERISKEYGLSGRAYNILSRRGFHRLGDFRYVDKSSFRDVRSVGEKVAKEVFDMLAHYGVELPEKLSESLEFPRIIKGDMVALVYPIRDNEENIPAGTVFKVVRVHEPSKHDPLPTYFCAINDNSGWTHRHILSVSEVTKI